METGSMIGLWNSGGRKGSFALYLPLVTACACLSILLLTVSCNDNSFQVPRAAAPLPKDMLVYSGPDGLTAINRNGSQSSVLVHREKATPPDEEGNIFLPTISPDRRTIAYVSSIIQFVEGKDGGFQTQSYSILMISSDGKTKRYFKPGKYRLAWEPDGSGAYYCAGYYIGWFGIPDGKESSLQIKGRGVKSVALSPSGHMLAWCARNKIGVGPVNTGKFTGPTRVVAELSSDALWMEWIDENELLMIETESTTFQYPNQGKPNETVAARRPYRSHIFRLNIASGQKTPVYDSDPWRIDQDLSMSPDRKEFAFTEGTQSHDPMNPVAEWANGYLPRGKIISLGNGVLAEIPVAVPRANPHTMELNWSSP